MPRGSVPQFALTVAVWAGCRSPAEVRPVDASLPSLAPTPSVPPREAGGETPTIYADAAAPIKRIMSNGASTTILSHDAGASACKLLRPPLMQTFGGPATIRFVHAGSTEVAELVFNGGGRPELSDAPILADAGTPNDVPMPPKTSLPGCAVARDFIFCPDANGDVHRTRGSGEEDRIVAHSRAGTSISAAPIGDSHVLLGYIREAVTSEGAVRQAEVLLDDGPPMRLSEEGSGATAIELAARGTDAVALIVDGRIAMTPTHIRVLRFEDQKLDLGRDAVVFVGGPAERHTAGTIAIAKDGATFALLALASGSDAFGMAAVRVSDPPKEDETVTWGTYENGIDPAPIAATFGLSPIRVACVRPTAKDEDASRVLELGLLDGEGRFEPRCIIAEAAYVKDVALAVDHFGTVWIFWRDTRGSHFERRALP